MLHHRHFGVQSTALLLRDSPQHVTVIGGGKSAADMVYACIKAGKQIDSIILCKNSGAGYILHLTPMGRYRNAAEASLTINATKFNPSAFRTVDKDSLPLHQSAEGREALGKMFAENDRLLKTGQIIVGEKNAGCNFKAQEPSYSLFWSNGPPGMIQHDDFFDLVSRSSNVHRADIVGTSSNELILDNGARVRPDMVLAGTVWDFSYDFLSAQQCCELGLPHDPDLGDTDDEREWRHLLDDADREIVEQFPILADTAPGVRPRKLNHRITPARLYRGILPLQDGSLVFLGRTKLPTGFFNAEAQAVWATAYWEGHIEVPQLEDCWRQITYMTAFSTKAMAV